MNLSPLPRAPLGHSGLWVSRIGFGTTGIGASPLRDDRAAVDRMVGAYLERGGNLFDAADSYNGGWSEAVLGRVLKGRRDRAVIATKVGLPIGPGAHDAGLGPSRIAAGVDESLRRLGTDYIDLYQVHLFDDDVALIDTLAALDAVVRAGKVRALGASSFHAWQLAEANALAAANGLTAFSATQLKLNLIRRDVQHEVLPYCASHDVGVIVFSPLQGGVLAGALAGGKTPLPGSRLASPFMRAVFLGKDPARAMAAADTVSAVAQARGVHPSQVSLAWVLAQRGVTTALLGAEALSEVMEGMSAVDFTLHDEDCAALECGDGFAPIYPADFYRQKGAMFADMRARAAEAGARPVGPQAD
jgi:aryl-alcohol dehydrogenase-like predicted oxidoreductase